MDFRTERRLYEAAHKVGNALVRFFLLFAGLVAGGRIGQNSQVARLQRRIQEQEDAISTSVAIQARAAAAFRNAHDELRQTEERMAIIEQNLRLYEQDLHGVRGATSSVEDSHRRAEAERQRIEELSNEAEVRALVANEQRARAKADAQGAKLEREDAVRSRLDAESIARDARVQQEEAENNLREGIRPVIWPTLAELQATKERLGYKDGLFHFAIAGIAGSGKSSLANALRGLRNGDDGAAATGVVETTDTIARYPDPDPKRPFVWYDVPGAGTLSVPDWQYFTDQGLYIFDCVIVLFDTRLTATDIAILRNCARFDIPTYIVRSKALQHIRNLAVDMPDDEDDDGESDEEDGTGPLALGRARELYIQETRASVAQNMEAADLSEKRVYLVDKDTLVSVVKNRPVKDALDEAKLLQDLLAEVHRRQVSEA
ncbi:hypothetical protein DAEQUDRAFT_243948 [Daedalea quercina L-15889]|uniref:IRG-type G domain-containing protein n=1 Tax=Daedalea quercina L-15889 TaxID=1314783 RepID=A0A165QSU7_9APHY|nr:hypothetical protein DAEQUDRAFT_243948 [Daedalea quercina L-15889]